MELRELTEEQPEGERIAIELEPETAQDLPTTPGKEGKPKLDGKLEKERHYTPDQRKELAEKVERFGRAHLRPENTPEPEGNSYAAILNNEEEDYTIRINPMSGITHVTLKQGRTEVDLDPINSYIEEPPQNNQYGQQDQKRSETTDKKKLTAAPEP